MTADSDEPTEWHEVGRIVEEPTEDCVLDDDVILMPVRPWTAEFTFTVLDFDPAALAAALHEAGEPHAPEDCGPCQRADRERRLADVREGLEQIGQALADLARALAEHFDPPPKPPTHGPVRRRSKNPKHH